MRSAGERATRRAVSWVFNVAVCVVSYTVAIIYCAGFGEKQTVKMLSSWVVSVVLAFFVVEPAQVNAPQSPAPRTAQIIASLTLP